MRIVISLKHSLAEGMEIHTVMPGKLEEFDEALAGGELRQLKAGLGDAPGEDHSWEADAERILQKLGLTVEELGRVYAKGSRSDTMRALRSHIDDRLLDIAKSGVDRDHLRLVTGLDRNTITRALTRARVARGERLAYRRNPSAKKRLAHRDGGAVCRYCGNREKLRRLTVDHVVPLSRGGTNALENLGLACAECNRAKGAHLVEEFHCPACWCETTSPDRCASCADEPGVVIASVTGARVRDRSTVSEHPVG